MAGGEFQTGDMGTPPNRASLIFLFTPPLDGKSCCFNVFIKEMCLQKTQVDLRLASFDREAIDISENTWMCIFENMNFHIHSLSASPGLSLPHRVKGLVQVQNERDLDN